MDGWVVNYLRLAIVSALPDERDAATARISFRCAVLSCYPHKGIPTVTTDTLVQPTTLTTGTTMADAVSDRRADIDAKMAKVAELLREVGCEGLLLLDPANFAWLTSGAMIRGLTEPAAEPAAYSNGEHRWIIASNVDSQRLFDEEVDGLGFQLKEWPWHWGRDQFLADLCHNRKVACDRPVNGSGNGPVPVLVAEQMRRLRRQ